MTSPADRQAEANADVERIAAAFYEEGYQVAYGAERRWADAYATERALHRALVRRMLERGVIRPGARPQVEPPMTGQTTIEEQLGD